MGRTKKKADAPEQTAKKQQEVNEHLQLWEAVEATDPKYTKNFGVPGGFKGTSTNTTYLVKKATGIFGPIGKGWGYEILEENFWEGHIFDELGNRSIIHVIRLRVWYMDGEQVIFTPPHMGQTTFVGKNKYGAFTDEEAPKKSVTDALTKCLSLLGFAADIHLGMYDDNKYVNDLKTRFAEENAKEGIDPALQEQLAESGGPKKAPKATAAAAKPGKKTAQKQEAAPEAAETTGGAVLAPVVWEYSKRVMDAKTKEDLVKIYQSLEDEFGTGDINQATFDKVKLALSKRKETISQENAK
jgi:hypothetical protein